MAKRNKSNKLKIIISLMVVLLICFSGFFYYYLLGISKDSKSVKTKPVKNDSPVNILVSGVDIGDPSLKGSNIPKRTDTIILMNYNPDNDEINIVSIPRDTLIRINGKNEKINAANAIGGQDMLIQSVEQLFDIDINYYGKVDYEGFDKIIDTIGGIDVVIKQNMNYDDASQNLHIHFKKGEKVHLDGKKAEEFFRWRKNNDGTGLADGDLGRIENQHEFIGKVVDKFKSPLIMTKIPSILSTVSKYSETNMQPEEMIKYAYLISKTDKSKITISTIKGDPVYVNDISYFAYNEKSNTELLRKIHGDNSSSVNTSGSANEYRKSLKIQVLNGTNINGLAKEYADKLKQKGYTNIVTGNGTKTIKSKAVLYGADKEYTDIIKQDVGLSNVEISQQKNENFDIIVILGEDYK
ncbi:MAG: putative cell envelope-related function transcriptional attenuator [Clostridiaceae bacterium]|nr:putative cell envelope-related function transcriptional attenuator [Clostridiaceae bacterium]